MIKAESKGGHTIYYNDGYTYNKVDYKFQCNHRSVCRAKAYECENGSVFVDGIHMDLQILTSWKKMR